jgi:hypothetical protein
LETGRKSTGISGSRQSLTGTGTGTGIILISNHSEYDDEIEHVYH